ncbi:hypothetical protein BH11PLA2_BH11PLA2_02590 [soil metagenome]
MDFALVTDLTGLAAEWNVLLATSITQTPFLRFEYLTAWWTTLGAPGEWPHGELHLLTGRRDGRLVGIAPLFVSVNHDGEAVLALLGTDAMTDALDFIARPDDFAPFLNQVFDHLNDSKTRGGQPSNSTTCPKVHRH